MNPEIEIGKLRCSRGKGFFMCHLCETNLSIVMTSTIRAQKFYGAFCVKLSVRHSAQATRVPQTFYGSLLRNSNARRSPVPIGDSRFYGAPFENDPSLLLAANRKPPTRNKMPLWVK